MIALNTAASLVLAAGEDESLKPGLKSSDVAPGTIGFIMTLILAILVVLLALDHTRRQRRLAARFDYAMAREAEERAAQAQAQPQAAATSAEDGVGSDAPVAPAEEPHRVSGDPEDPRPRASGPRDRPGPS